MSEELRDIAPAAIRMEVEMSGIRILRDRTVKVSFTSLLEVDDADVLFLVRKQTSTGWLIYSERALDEQDVPQDPLTSQAKSPSARLRSVLYVAWSKKYPDHAQRVLNSFESFYAATIEGYIERVKARIDELEQGA